MEHQVVTTLREGRAIPRAVKRDERAAVISIRKLIALVDRDVVRSPVRRKSRDGCELLRALADGFATVTAVLRSEHELVLLVVEITFRPAVVAAVFDLEQLFGR